MFVGSHESRAQNRGGGPPPDETRQTPKAAAPADLTGYWVSVVTEDWRYRMVTPAKGDYQGVPMTAEAAKVADAWDPTSDEAAGQQCRSYGAGAIMRVPGRIRVTWQDDTTLQLDVDAGMQTRLFRFEPSRASPGEPTWQGESTAQWETPTGRGRGNNQAARKGSLKVVTRNLRSGYLRKNGVPYGESAVVTEYFDVAPLNNGSTLLIVTTIVEDPRYLRQPFIVSSQFKKQADASGWDPTPCSATW
jgi:hypothetical protein